jgi:hypothetical protein
MTSVATTVLKNECRKLVDFLQRNFAIRIDEIVFDFMRDCHSLWYLLSCKGFTLNAAAESLKEIRRVKFENMTQGQIAETKLDEKSERTNAARCMLCLYHYKIHECQWTLPFLMLVIYKMHT